MLGPSECFPQCSTRNLRARSRRRTAAASRPGPREQRPAREPAERGLYRPQPRNGSYWYPIIRFVLYGDKVAPALRPDSFPERGGEELLLGGLRLSDFEVRLKAVP